MGRSRFDNLGDLEQIAGEKNYQIREFALAVGICRRHLRRKIKERFRKSLHKWMMDIRLQKALALREKGKTLKEIAEILHFKQISHLCRLLRQAQRTAQRS